MSGGTNENNEDPYRTRGDSWPGPERGEREQAGDGAPRDSDKLAADRTSRGERPEAGSSPVPLPRQFGRYEILREVGRGGMGIVYRARDPKLNRTIALKVLIAGDTASEQLIQRFQVEARSAARLRHPNIVSVHDVGAEEGRRYFTMDFVEGRPLSQALRAGRLSLGGLLQVLETTARAVHYAHTQGIIHRDLKPGNVLLGLQGEPQVSDFGLAKDVRADFALTRSGASMGTPAYMPPEQAKGEAKEVDARSDVYALGAILYEMLTARPPFTADNEADLLRQVCEQDPVRPRMLTASVPADVETICLKCLAKERERRYQTAAGLADDIGRYLRGEPIQARPSSIWYRTKKRLLRNRTATAVGAISVLAVLALLSAWIVTLGQRTRQAERERSRAELAADAEREAKEQAEEERTKAAQLAEAERRAREQAEHSARAEREARGEAEEERRRALEQLAEKITSNAVRFAVAGDYAAAVSACAEAREIRDTLLRHLIQWNAERGRPHPWRVLRHRGAVSSVAISPNGSLLATACLDGSIGLWDLTTGSRARSLKERRGRVLSVAFSPDGALLASGSDDGAVRLLDAATGTERFELPGKGTLSAPLAFSPDGKLLAAGLRHGTIALWEVATQRLAAELRGYGSAVRSVAFSPDGKLLASASADRTIRIRELAKAIHASALWPASALWRKERTLTARWLRSASTVAFSPDGKVLAAGLNSGSIAFWTVGNWKEATPAHAHSGAVTALSFSPTGAVLASGSSDGAVKVWHMERREVVLELRGHGDSIASVAFSADGRLLVSGGDDRTAQVWSLAAGGASGTLPGPVDPDPHCAVFASRGRDSFLAVGSMSGSITVKEVATGRSLQFAFRPGNPVLDVAFSPARGLLASAALDSPVKVWGLKPETLTRASRTAQRWGLQAEKSTRAVIGDWLSATAVLAISPDGRLLATGSFGKSVKLWNIATSKETAVLEQGDPTALLARQAAGVCSLAFSLDGALLASGSEDKTVRVWDVAAGRQAHVLHGHTGAVSSLAFSPDGQLLASGSFDNTIKLWDVAGGTQRRTLAGHSRPVVSVAFSPDGHLLASGSGDRTIKVWNVTTGQEARTLWGHKGTVLAVAFGATGSVLLSYGRSGIGRTWDIAPPRSPERWLAAKAVEEGRETGTVGIELVSVEATPAVAVRGGKVDLESIYRVTAPDDVKMVRVRFVEVVTLDGFVMGKYLSAYDVEPGMHTCGWLSVLNRTLAPGLYEYSLTLRAAGTTRTKMCTFTVK